MAMTSPTTITSERMLRLFAYEHLQHADLRALSKRFSDFAHDLVETVPRGPERTVALCKLLEAKDAAVRAVASACASRPKATRSSGSTETAI